MIFRRARSPLAPNTTMACGAGGRRLISSFRRSFRSRTVVYDVSRSVRIRRRDMSPMEPRAIFELIVQADEKIKYAKPGVADARANQARDLLRTAIDEARAIGNEALVEQAER